MGKRYPESVLIHIFSLQISQSKSQRVWATSRFGVTHTPHTLVSINMCFAARLSITITHSVSSVVYPLFRCCSALALRKGPAAAATAADR